MTCAARFFPATLLLAAALFGDICTAGEVFTMSQLKAAVKECNDTYFLSQTLHQRDSPTATVIFSNTENWDSVFTTGSIEDERDLVAKCFCECVLEKTGAMDEKGTINSDVTKAVFLASHEGTGMATEGHDELIDMCVPAREETDICEKGYALVKCVTVEELSRRQAGK